MTRIVIRLLVLSLFAAATAHADTLLGTLHFGFDPDNYFVRQAASWTAQDTALVGIGEALTVLDLGQTRYIARHPAQYQETNAILGRHPGDARVDTYFAAVLLTNLLVPYLLPQQCRTIAESVYIGVEAAATSGNYRVGIRTTF